MQVALLVALLSAAAFVASAEEVSSVGQSVGQQQPQHQPGQLVPVVHSVSSSGEQVHHMSGGAEPHGHVHEVHHHAQDGHPHDHPGHQQFVPAGVIQVVGPQQYSSGVVGASGSASGPVASSEQYGKPESASIPPNYKPFGSWGLYIGGNPADGYYSNYYKALGNSVDKQQVSGVEQAAGPMKAGQVSAFQPMLRQAVGSNGASYADQVYPFDYYTPADLNSGSRVAVLDSQSGGPSSYASGVLSSPASIGAQVYGAPIASAYNNQPEVSNYADAYYSTKRVGSSSSSFGVTKGQGERAQQQQQQVQQVEVPAKGYAQQPRYAYVQSPAHYQQVHHYAASQGPQVVAYPVPVGSQIVGSQPGTDGAYAPYGVHGYTRYAVKPTVVANSEQQYYHQGVHSAPIGHFPVYKQQQQQQQQHHQQQHQAGVAYQPLSFYGYPLNQLHYSSASQGSIVPAFNQQHGSSSVSSSPSVGVHEHQTGGAAVMMAPAPVGQVEAASSEKSESTQSAAGESKPAKEQQQKS